MNEEELNALIAEVRRLRAERDELKALARQVVEDRQYIGKYLDTEFVAECVISVLMLLRKIDDMK